MSDEKMEFTYICSYEFDGLRWHLEIKADSFENASARLRAIGLTGCCDGRYASVDGLLTRVWKAMHLWEAR